MATQPAQADPYPEEVRKHSAHVLAGLVTLQGTAALGGFTWLVVREGRAPTQGIAAFFLLVAALSFFTAILEWSRVRVSEMMATFTILLSFGLTLGTILAGLWYLVPFIGLTTIASIFGLVDRFAVRDDSRHQAGVVHHKGH
jgi:hypothetical protein